MPRPRVNNVLNLDTPETKRRLLAFVGALRGFYAVKVEPKRDSRSLRQNAWYHACIVEPFRQFLADQDYEATSHEAAHEILKAKFLTVEIADPQTGEVIGRRVRGSSDLSTEEFSDYCERCRAWLLDFFGIVTQDADPAYASVAGGRGHR